jgi:ABC-type lipoprotein export system ATPase subunit/ABC-type antimicrobial peptide transport system permease subunit
VIIIKDLLKKYDQRIVLKIDYLEINDCEVTAIVGASGSGKTTLLNIIGTLDLPDKGSIEFACDGKSIDIFKQKSSYRASKVGFVFQDYNLIEGMSVANNLRIGNYYSGIAGDAKALLEYFQIPDPKQNASTLSGGEKQRVSLCRAISRRTKIILADEPSGNLDSENAEKVFRSLRDLGADKHVVIVTHDERLAEKYADRIIRLVDGVVVEDKRNTASGTIADVSPAKIQESENIRSRKSLKLKAAFLLALNSIKRRVWRMLSLAIVIGLAIASVVTVLDINESGRKISDKIDKNYLETDLISVYYEKQPMLAAGEKPIDTAMIADLLDDYGINEIVGNYGDRYFFALHEKIIEAETKIIHINSFFNERVMSNEIIGNFPVGDDRVIISEKVALELFETTDCLDEKILITNGEGNSLEVTVAGVNLTKNPSGDIYSFIPFALATELKHLTLAESTDIMIEEMRYEIKLGMISGKAIKAKYRESLGTETVLLGSLPQGTGEILDVAISSFLLPYFYSTFAIDAEEHDAFEELQNVDLGFVYNGLHKVRICGVFASEENDVIFSRETIEFLTTPLTTHIQIYIKNIEESEEITDFINARNIGLYAISQYENLRLNITKNTRFFQYALIFIGVLLFVMSLFMLNSFVKLTTSEREKEIAILKSLGGATGDVLWTLWLDIAFISLAAILLSMLFFLGIYIILSHIFVDIKILSFTYPLDTIIYIGLFYLFDLSVLSLFSILKVAGKPPSVLMKR